MPVSSLTKRMVDALPHPARGQILYRDAQFRGLGLRVGKTTKVWFAEGQVAQRTRRVTIGRADLILPDAARKKAMAILNEMLSGVDPNQAKREALAERITLDEAFDGFFKAKPDLSPFTVDAYQRTRTLYLKAWKNKCLQEISRQMVLAEHRRISGRSGNATANSVFRHFRSVYNFTAAIYDSFPPNPAGILTQARAWHKERRRRRLISVSQLPSWWATVANETRDARDILLFALFTGMRRSEVLTLRWESVDLAGKALHLPTTKNGDPLDLPMSDFVAELISDRRELVGQSEWVFPGDGESGHIIEIKSFIARVVEASGVEFSMHDLRRTFVTVAESLDVSAYALKRLLNHRADTDVTGGYIIIDAERLRAPAQLVAKKLVALSLPMTAQDAAKPTPKELEPYHVGV